MTRARTILVLLLLAGGFAACRPADGTPAEALRCNVAQVLYHLEPPVPVVCTPYAGQVGPGGAVAGRCWCWAGNEPLHVEVYLYPSWDATQVACVLAHELGHLAAVPDGAAAYGDEARADAWADAHVVPWCYG